MPKTSILRTNHRTLECLELAVAIAAAHCDDEDRKSISDALVWVKSMRDELDEPLLKVCKLSQIIKCSNEYFELCDEKEEIRKELQNANHKVAVLLTSITASKLQALA